MAMIPPEKATIQQDYSGDIRYIHSRIDNLNNKLDVQNKKITLLVRLLVDKKIVGGELAKSFSESKEISPETIDKLIEWFKNKP